MHKLSKLEYLLPINYSLGNFQQNPKIQKLKLRKQIKDRILKLQSI